MEDLYRDIKNFSPSEFRKWRDKMSREILECLDRFREGWGYKVMVSPVNGGLGRQLGPSLSMHNVDMWDEVKACDFFPMLRDENRQDKYIETTEDRVRAYNCALEAGFTGIGIYTDTKPGNMIHGDVRPTSGRIAKWSRVEGEYLGINEVLV